MKEWTFATVPAGKAAEHACTSRAANIGVSFVHRWLNNGCQLHLKRSKVVWVVFGGKPAGKYAEPVLCCSKSDNLTHL
jgi:hypothetical protein